MSGVEEAQQKIAAWQRRASEAGMVLRAPPPLPTTCCGRGCAGCVWEGWFDAVAWWCEDAQARFPKVEFPSELS